MTAETGSSPATPDPRTEKPEWAMNQREIENARRRRAGEKPLPRRWPWVLLTVAVLGGAGYWYYKTQILPTLPTAEIVSADVRFVLVEGNYLLLDEEPWSRLAPLFDFTIFVDVPRAELEHRLCRRWHEHGRSEEDALAWIATNDLPNIERVLARRRPADMVVGQVG